ncbi:reverse transcriptase domain-containing protein [Tanacetum coccineum]
MEFTYALRFEFTATNNEAEYEALMRDYAFMCSFRMGVPHLRSKCGLPFGTNHVLVKMQVPRGDNKKADALSKIASTSFAHLSKQVLVKILKNKSISEMEISTVIEEQDPTWMTPIIEFINKGTLPQDQKDATRKRRTAQRFELRNGVLYRRSFLQPWLRCVGPIIRPDYVLYNNYCPPCIRDARDMIRKCNDCQVRRPISRLPQQELTPITSPWPFHKWGIDIAGPFPVAAGGLKFLIVAIDYFTKWNEAKERSP